MMNSKLQTLKSKLYQLIWLIPLLHKSDYPAFKFLRSYIYKKLNRRKIIRHCTFKTKFFNLNYTGDLYNFIDNRIYRFGGFEKHILFFIRDVLSVYPLPTFIDIGANVGQHSLFAAQYANVVHAFEPFPEVLEQFRKNIAINFIKNIHIHSVGVGYESAIKKFFLPPEKMKGRGSFLSGFNSETGQEMMLSIVKGDEYLFSQGIDTFELMKIDVEGYEKFVLMGLQTILTKVRPIIVMEITKRMRESFQTFQELLDLLPKNYYLYLIERKNRSERSGAYLLKPMNWDAILDQADIVACPHEKQCQLTKTMIH